MKKLTTAQCRALRLAADSGGELIIGGLDGQPVRPDVAMRLYERGFLAAKGLPLGAGPSLGWRLTTAGRAAIADEDGA